MRYLRVPHRNMIAFRPCESRDDDSKRTRAEGLDPDGLAVRAALDLVRWELELMRPTRN